MFAGHFRKGMSLLWIWNDIFHILHPMISFICAIGVHVLHFHLDVDHCLPQMIVQIMRRLHSNVLVDTFARRNEEEL